MTPGGGTRMRPPHGGLPYYGTSFLGREADLAALKQALESSRLVTVVGPGGCGKTRLVVELGLAQSLPVTFVALDQLSDHDLVWTAVADAAGLQRNPNADARDVVIDAFAVGRRLLVLDSCEHLQIVSAAMTRELLARCPDVTVLATSRTPLGLPAEDVVLLKPLLTPSQVGETLVADAFACPSLQLFYERASARGAGLSPTPSNARAAVRLCDLLEGIPLAIELAAAWAHAFTVEEMLELVARTAGTLRTSDPFAPERHESLNATIEWSARLLSSDELHLLKSLAVFSGGANLDAISHVCRPDAGDGSPHPLVAKLVASSLVTADSSASQTRYRLLEPIRQWCLARLEPEVEETLRRRHAAFFADFAEAADRVLRSAGQIRARAEIDRELANLRAAMKWATEHDAESGAALRTATGLAFYWPMKGRVMEGRRWIEAALAAYRRPDAARARGLTAAAFLAWRGDEPESGLQLAREAVETSRGVEDALLEAIALTWIGMLSVTLGLLSEARQAVAEAQPVLVQRDASHDIVRCHVVRARCCLLLSELDAAREEAWAGLSIARTVGDRAQISGVYDLLGGAERDPALACQLYGEALALRRESGDFAALCDSLYLLARARLHQPIEVAALVEEGLVIAEAQADRVRAGLLLLVLAQAAQVEHPEAAASVAAHGLALITAAEAGLDPRDRALVDAVRDTLGPVEPPEPSVDAAVRAGRALTRSVARPSAPTAGRFHNPHRLTPRETEVLGLIAQGYTNAEIAARLSASVRTVERHISNLYGKIGARGKADATAYALRQGLDPST